MPTPVGHEGTALSLFLALRSYGTISSILNETSRVIVYNACSEATFYFFSPKHQP